MSAGIEDEPALIGTARVGDIGADAIGGEAALDGTPEAALDKVRLARHLRDMWNRPPRGNALLRFLGLCTASGVFAVLCAIVKGTLGFGLLAISIGAPVIEETAKVILPLMCLEKKPWQFRSAIAIASACIVSALVFATIENLLYFFVYIPKERLGDGIIMFRLTVCTTMHVGCATISACGLVRAWREARGKLCDFSTATALPYLVVAMAIHGLYNGIAIFAG